MEKFGDLPTLEEYRKMTLTQLKVLCEKHGLVKESLAQTEKGKKQELIDRLLTLIVEDNGSYKMIKYNYEEFKEPVVSKDYDNMTVAELKYMIDIRNNNKKTNEMTKTGTKAMLIRKLREDDAKW